MKTSTRLILLGLTISFSMLSCERADRIGFAIEFSDETFINEANLAFYDSSTCILFLKEKIILPAISDKKSNPDYPEFSLYIDEDIIYKGVIYPMVAMISPFPYFIPEQPEPTEVIPLNFVGLYTGVTDARNDQRIINCLDNKNKLLHGISCTLESVVVHSYIDSSVTCTISIKNNDIISYYIPDPEKMGAERFEYYVGGIILRNLDTDVYLQAETKNSSTEWNMLTMDHLSLLESNGVLTYSYTISLDASLLKGNYACDFDFGRMSPFGPAIPENLNLEQDSGRVWLGGTRSRLDAIIFE